MRELPPSPQPKRRRQRAPDKLHIPRRIPLPETITPTTPLRLDVAARLAFPDGSMTASGLRREGRRGRLVIERIAGKDFTTLHHNEDMRLKCRDQQRAQGSGLNPKSVTPATSSRHAAWVICDGPRKVRTGCARSDRAGAERALAEYIASKYQVPRERNRHPTEILVLDVLNIYLADKARKHARPEETKQRVLTLADFWQPYTLAGVNGNRCREYVTWRVDQPWKSARPARTGNAPRLVTEAAARRELEDLRAAINHHRREGFCSEIVSVVLPLKSANREVWLTRPQAARLIWAALRAKQIMQDRRTERAVGRHLARFILTGLYTGSRSGAICGAAFMPTIGRGHVAGTVEDASDRAETHGTPTAVM